MQSGLHANWSGVATEDYQKLRKIQDLLSDGKTPSERGFDAPFDGLIIPFGAELLYHTISAKDQNRQHQFASKVIPCMFIGYDIFAERSWSENLLNAYAEDLKNSPVSKIHVNTFK